MKPIEVLKKYWGYESFRPLQEQIIDRVLRGEDTVALLPTGGGKSITYQVPALMLPGVTIVVTPLVALMKDQVDVLTRLGIRAVCINSSMSHREIDVALDNCVYGDVKLLYIAPERIATPIFRARLLKMQVSLLAIDEAHCISQWGYDFRPAYLKIAQIRSVVRDVPVLAVTATATAIVVGDIVRHLELRDPQILRTSFERPNLRFVVRTCDNKLEQILRVTEHVAGAGIVYVRTRADAELVSDFLRSKGVSADHYHAGLGFRIRAQKQSDWMSGRMRVVVSTNAFGMGIDKADVRFVIHHQIPESMEAYYQEAGRAGRDGQTAYAVVMYNPGDARAATTRIDMGFPPIETIRQVYEAIHNYYQIGIGEGQGLAREFNLRDFTMRFRMFGLTVVNAIKILELNGYMMLTDEVDNPTRVMFRLGREELYRVQIAEQHLDGVLKALMRNYTGLFSQFVAVEEEFLVKVSGYSMPMVQEKLLQLSRMKVIHYIPRRRTPLLVLLEERLPTADVVIAPETYLLRRDQMLARSLATVDYATNQSECRSVMLCRYFDQTDASDCGVCDVCVERRKRGLPIERKQIETEVEQQILEILRAESCSLYDLVGRFSMPVSLVLPALRGMMDRGVVCQQKNGRIVIA